MYFCERSHVFVYLVGAKGCRSLLEFGCCGGDSVLQRRHPKQTHLSQSHLIEIIYNYNDLLLHTLKRHSTMSSHTEYTPSSCFYFSASQCSAHMHTHALAHSYTISVTTKSSLKYSRHNISVYRALELSASSLRSSDLTRYLKPYTKRRRVCFFFQLQGTTLKIIVQNKCLCA